MPSSGVSEDSYSVLIYKNKSLGGGGTLGNQYQKNIKFCLSEELGCIREKADEPLGNADVLISVLLWEGWLQRNL
jgi:predicted RNase H-like nuclease (RuvC/YqgF family)